MTRLGYQIPSFSYPGVDQSGVFAVQPSDHRAELTQEMDVWLQRLCTFDPEERPSASNAMRSLENLLDRSQPHRLDGGELAPYSGVAVWWLNVRLRRMS